jgi:hypothetical protein
MSVDEPRVNNSGLTQGTFVKKQVRQSKGAE